MMDRHNLISYLATISGIVFLSIVGALVCVMAPANTEVNLARVIGALAFIGSAVAGLTGIAGTFKGRQNGMSEEATSQLLDKVPPTEGQDK